MFKTIRDILIGAFIAGLVSAAMATVGQPPVPATGPGLVDGTWLNGLAGGVNSGYQYGLTAVTPAAQSTAVQIPAGVKLMEFDTVSSSGAGGALPPCYQGTEFGIYNNGAGTLTIYPNVTNNPVTGVQDTIDNSTSVTVSSHTAEIFFCAKTGNWAAK